MQGESSTNNTYQTLDALIGTAVETGRFLRIAINITQLIALYHDNGLIHNKLCPRQFGFNPRDNSVYLITEDIPEAKSQNKLTTLAYISPEQTGRMNRAIDYRSDLYSLGIIFYQLATGVLPFIAEDALEWAHSHIAKTAVPPVRLSPDLPTPVSDIIMKLISKTAEYRYQTAYGLRYDLEKCLDQFLTHGAIPNFTLGINDISRQLLIPQKLYGREKETALLKDSLQRVIAYGSSELLVISGYSGIGKTSLVHELHAPIIAANGVIISGKFDQYKNNIPYATFGEAFRDLIRQILTESEEQIVEWRENIRNALGINGRLITELIPQLELIIGKQAPVQELTASEAENRFNTTFQKFISVFANKKHPLIIFLDDLQWADPASLKLMHSIILDPETRYLLLVGAYRENEVTLSHPLMLICEAINKVSGKLHTLRLSPLPITSVTQLLVDTFTPHEIELDTIADLIHEKTGGNPFFVTQFLNTLYEEKLVEFDTMKLVWKWDTEKIRAKGYSDNVVDLMTDKMRKLPVTTQEVLMRAACIGNNFDLETIQAIFEQSNVELPLTDAVQGKFLLNNKENYFFLHDRIQQAAYLLIPEEERAGFHLSIARLMLRKALDGTIEEKSFDIVNQYNSAIKLITDKEEKLSVAGLNLIAAKKAKASTAYSTALEYLNHAISLINDDDWEDNYALAFELYRETAELEYLNCFYDKSKELIYFLLSKANQVLDKARLYNILIVQCTLLARYEEAISYGRKALGLFNVIVPQEALQTELEKELVRYDELLGERQIITIAEAPEMSDKTARVCLELLSNMVVPARYSNNDLFAVIVLLNVNWSLQHGPTAKSTVGYSCFGMFLSDKMQNFNDAYQFGLAALALSNRFDAMTQRCQSSFVLGHYLIHWVKHLREVDVVINDGMQAGLASGEMQWTGYTMAYRLCPPFYRGEPIKQVLGELPRLMHFTKKTHNQWASDTLTGFRLALAELSEPERKSGSYDETEYIEACKGRKSFGALGRYYVLKLQVQYLFGEFGEAARTAGLATELSGFFSSSISVPALTFYHTLTCAALYPSATSDSRIQLLSRIQHGCRQMKTWVASCPENFQHQSLLIEAELAVLEENIPQAMLLYEQSIKSARTNGYVQNEALAFERAAHFYRLRGFDTIADSYIEKGYALYIKWGADKKANQLEKQFTWLAQTSSKNIFDSQLGTIDAISVIKASQTISGEIVLHRLLEQLIRIVMENAGAQKGCLLLYHGYDADIAIEATADGSEIKLIPSLTGHDVPHIPETISNYVRRTNETLIIDDATDEDLISGDSYVLRHKPLSILCLPLLRQGNLTGLLYLENKLMRGAFTNEHVAVLELLTAQAAISLENARLYEERSHAEDELRKSKEKYRQIFDHCGTALVFIEEDTTLSLCNKEFEQLSGYERSEVEGILKWSETVAYPEELQKMREYHRLRRIDSNLAPQSYEFHLIDKQGEIKDVSAIVTTIPGTQQSMAALQDITERNRNETDRVRLVTAIEQSADAIFITDLNWQITYANQACLHVTGYDRSELIGKHVNSMKSDQHDKTFYANIRDILDRGEAWTGRLTLKKKNGTNYEADATNAAVKDQYGHTVNYVCTHRDVSNELKLEQDLRQAQKMEAIGTLAGGIAHDFNNLLTAILGSTELATAKIGNESSAARDLKRISEAGNRAKELVAQILTYSRQRDQEKKNVHVAAIIDEVTKLLRASIPSTIDIQNHNNTSADSDVVFADSTQLHQVIMNLGTNAAHAMRESGGVLSISLSYIETDSVMRAQHASIPHGSCVRITVSDTGHGMDNATKVRIFDPYFTTKTFGEGTGMGLAVVEGIVKSHGGSIHVYSEPGQGSTFHIFLPCSEPMLPNESIEQPEILHGGSEKILFVDDEEILSEMGKDLFESLGYDVTSTTSSIEALKLFKESPQSFDLIITDMTMPYMTGKELAEQIMLIRPKMPIILCTGFSDSINEELAEKLGIKAFVMKPYSINLLDAIVRKVLYDNIPAT